MFHEHLNVPCALEKYVYSGFLEFKKIPGNKTSGLDSFTGEFYQTYKEELIQVLFKLFQKIEEDGTLPNLFYKATIALIPKPDKVTLKEENYMQGQGEKLWIWVLFVVEILVHGLAT